MRQYQSVNLVAVAPPGPSVTALSRHSALDQPPTHIHTDTPRHRHTQTYTETLSDRSLSDCQTLSDVIAAQARPVGVNVLVGGSVWCSGNALVSINAVALHRARLVLGWVTAFGQVNCLIT